MTDEQFQALIGRLVIQSEILRLEVVRLTEEKNAAKKPVEQQEPLP